MHVQISRDNITEPKIWDTHTHTHTHTHIYIYIYIYIRVVKKVLSLNHHPEKKPYMNNFVMTTHYNFLKVKKKNSDFCLNFSSGKAHTLSTESIVISIKQKCKKNIDIS